METASVERRITAVCLLILTALALAGAMYLFAPVLLPFVLAILLTYCLSPIIDVQIRRLRLPRPVALVTTVLLACVVLVLLGLIVSAAASEVRAHVDEYEQDIRQMAERFEDSALLAKFGIEMGDGRSLLQTLTATLARAVRGTVSGIMSILSNGVLVLIFTIFMLAGRAQHAEPGSVLHEVETRTKRYILTMVSISAVTGVLVGTALSVLGVPFAWMFGFLAFLLNFIPSIGSVIATLLPVPAVLLAPNMGPVAQILAIALPAAIQFGIGNILQPKIMGQSLDLHPVVILMSLIFFGIIWGIVGMFLATPLIAIVKILLERFEYTRSVGALLAGRLGGLTRAGGGKARPELGSGSASG